MTPYKHDTDSVMADFDACLEEVRRRHGLDPRQAASFLAKQQQRLRNEAAQAPPPPGLTPEQLVGWATADAPPPYDAPANLTGLRLRVLAVMRRYAEERVAEAARERTDHVRTSVPRR